MDAVARDLPGGLGVYHHRLDLTDLYGATVLEVRAVTRESHDFVVFPNVTRGSGGVTQVRGARRA